MLVSPSNLLHSEVEEGALIVCIVTEYPKDLFSLLILCPTELALKLGVSGIIFYIFTLVPFLELKSVFCIVNSINTTHGLGFLRPFSIYSSTLFITLYSYF